MSRRSLSVAIDYSLVLPSFSNQVSSVPALPYLRCCVPRALSIKLFARSCLLKWQIWQDWHRRFCKTYWERVVVHDMAPIA